jgi:hypothetical protein
MQARRLDQDSIEIFATRAELDILHQYLNEVCTGAWPRLVGCHHAE